MIKDSEAQVAVPLDQGQLAPYQGILLKSFVFDDLVKAKKKEIALEQLVESYKVAKDFSDYESEKYKVELKEEKRSSVHKSIGFFTLGVIGTFVVMKAQESL